MEIATARLILNSPWITQKPTEKQLRFLARPEFEVFYGGAAGGAKSSALLMAALMFADVPNYAAMIFRKTYSDLSLPGALMDRAAEWLQPTAARWREQEKTWHFPSGATLSFGYLDGPKDRFRYQGSELSFIGMDEATQIREEDYLYLFSRLRKSREDPFPLRMRPASNPGGESHAFFHERFVAPKEPNSARVFVPALLEDNPHLDRQEYERSLNELDETTYRQLRRGEWIEHSGEAIFKREWWDRSETRYDPADRFHQLNIRRRVQIWDTGFLDSESASYSACITLDVLSDYRVAVRDVWRKRMEFPELEQAIVYKAKEQNTDGLLTNVILENRASAQSALQTLGRSAPAWLRGMLSGFAPKGSKDEKCRQAAHFCAPGLVLLPRVGTAQWLFMFCEEELFMVPNAKTRDMTDAFSLGIIRLEQYLAQAYRALKAA